MNPNFPIAAKYERFRIQGDVRNAQNIGRHPDPTIRYLKSRGVRYVVEAPGSSAEQVRTMAQEMWGVGVEVRRLFQDDFVPPDSLRTFYLVVIPGVAFSELSGNPYDLAYALLSATDYRSVEPDLPYVQFPPPGGTAPPPLLATHAATDHAWALRRIRAPEAWNLVTAPPGQQDGCGISIAHLDTGWTDHDDLDVANFDVARRWDFINPQSDAHDPMIHSGPMANPGHGTRTGSVMMSDGDVDPVSGTIPPNTVTGVARHATYIAVRCIWSVIVIYASDIAQAVQYATHCHSDVISMSLGGFPLRALRKAIEDATANHLLVVCAAGNHARMVVWPARYRNAIALAATDNADAPWSGSSRGPKVDVSAPGEDVWVAEPNLAGKGKAISQGSGTSYATALMAGAAALWLAFHHKPLLVTHAVSVNLELQEIFRDALRNTAHTPVSWNRNLYGTGIADVYALLQLCVIPLPGVVPPAITAIPRVGADYLDDAIATSRQLIARSPVALLTNVTIEAFDHEFARIFMDDANEPSPTSKLVTPENVGRILAKRGSLTLRSVLGYD